MEQFESNSIKRREDIANKDAVEKKKLEKVTKHQITVKKKSLSQRASEALLSDEAPSIGSYILGDVLIPAIKDTLADMATSAINMAFMEIQEAAQDLDAIVLVFIAERLDHTIVAMTDPKDRRRELVASMMLITLYLRLVQTLRRYSMFYWKTLIDTIR